MTYRSISAALAALLLLLPSCSTEPVQVDETIEGSIAEVQDTEDSLLSLDDQLALAEAKADAAGVQGKGKKNKRSRRPATVRRGAKRYVALHIEFDTEAACKALKLNGVHVLTRFKKWADVLMVADSKVERTLVTSPGLRWIDVGRRGILPPPQVGRSAASRARPELLVRGGARGLTGKNVIVAVIDSGVDFRHPDFVTVDARGRKTSRIRYLWDTTSRNFEAKKIGSKAPLSYPNGASLGTLYTRQQLTADLRLRRSRIGVTDGSGHGTSCAGVAAGNGRGHRHKRYLGVAPQADIIAVRIGGGSGQNIENMYLLGAICDWLHRVAGKQPCVISCSFGGQYGARDGTRVLERQLDSRFAAAVTGRALCVSAGNNGHEPLHGSVTFTDKVRGTLQWEVPKGKVAIVTVYNTDAALSDFNYVFRGPKLGKSQIRWKRRKLTGRFFLTLTSPAGKYSMQVWGRAAKRVTMDAYITKGGRFLKPSARAGVQVGTPGTTGQAITVGSYDFNHQIEVRGRITTRSPVLFRGPMTIGGLSRYSNPGPRRDRRMKPELVAPGQYHIAAVPTYRIPGDRGNPRETTGHYRTFNGTSASTPYTAGVIALMFEKNPNLTVTQVRTLLKGALSRDSFTGRLPNSRWGHGKLNVAAVRKVLNSVPKK